MPAVRVSGTINIENAVIWSGVSTVAISVIITVIISQLINVNAHFLQSGAFNISNLTDYSYFIGWLGTSISRTLPIQSQISSEINSTFSDLFVLFNIRITINQGQEIYITDTKYFEYVRLSLSLNGGSPITVLAYFQGVK